MGITTAISS